MPSKYSRKNRDRRGGHQVSPIAMGDALHVDPDMKAFVKRHTMKVIRRQHAKAIAEGVHEHDQEMKRQCLSYFTGYMDVDDYLERENYQGYLDGYPEEEDYDRDDRFDDDWYDYGYDQDYDDHHGYDLDQGKDDALDRVITFEQRGMTLREVIREFMDN